MTASRPAPTVRLADRHDDDGAALRREFTSIVRTQNARTTDGPATSGRHEHEAMTDAQLDAALTVIEKHFIDRMHTRRTDPANHGDYADAMRAALTRYGDAITRADTVLSARDRYLAACDVQRFDAHLAIITLYPESIGLLSALDDTESAHRGLVGAFTGAGDALGNVHRAAAVADGADTRYGVARLAPAAYTAFLVALPHYMRHRCALAAPIGDDAAAVADDIMTALATRLDRARADMAAAFARDRRTAAASYAARRTMTGTV